MQGVELEAVEIELDGAPRVGADQVAEIVGELYRREIVQAVIEILPHAPNGATIGIDGLGLQALKLEVFEMRNIALIKLSTSIGGGHVVVPSRIVQNHPNRIDEVSVQVKSCQQYIENLLRVAASSMLTLSQSREK